VQVDTGTVRNRGQLVSDVVGDRHGPRTDQSEPGRNDSLFPEVSPVEDCQETVQSQGSQCGGLAI
jgi:hypothetical protein